MFFNLMVDVIFTFYFDLSLHTAGGFQSNFDLSLHTAGRFQSNLPLLTKKGA
jgi:hypothetical protein